MRKFMIASIGALAILGGGLGIAEAASKKAMAPGQDRVCLVTFKTHEQATAGADADVVRAKLLPRKAAMKQANYDDGGAVRIFEYGNNTAAQCKQLNPS